MDRHLLYAQAAVDWAVAHLPSFEQRLHSWMEQNLHTLIEELEPHIADNLIVMAQKEPFPLAFSVEAGAYINVIRTSLDVLATSLVDRYRMADCGEPCFPVANSADDFSRGNYKGSKFIKALPGAPRKTIEKLRPYNGGNPLLWALHKLDIERKHKRMLYVGTAPDTFTVTASAPSPAVFTPVSTGWVDAGDKAILGLISKGSKTDVEFTAQVTIYEPEFLPRIPVIRLLYDFAGLATSIIKRFDN